MELLTRTTPVKPPLIQSALMLKLLVPFLVCVPVQRLMILVVSAPFPRISQGHKYESRAGRNYCPKLSGFHGVAKNHRVI